MSKKAERLLNANLDVRAAHIDYLHTLLDVKDAQIAALEAQRLLMSAEARMLEMAK